MVGVLTVSDISNDCPKCSQLREEEASSSVTECLDIYLRARWKDILQTLCICPVLQLVFQVHSLLANGLSVIGI